MLGRELRGDMSALVRIAMLVMTAGLPYMLLMIMLALVLGMTSAVLLTVSEVRAHEIWLEKHEDGLVLLYGHRDSTHGEADTIKYDPEEVLRVECHGIDGEGGEITLERAYPLVTPDTCGVTYVLTSSGYWAKTPFGTRRLPKDEAKSPLESWFSYESVKRIDAWDGRFARPVTGDLELSPIKNPLGLSEGKKVRLLATIGGEPAAGIPVAYAGKTRGVTGSDGRVNIKLRHGGIQMIQASYSEPGDSVKADEIIHTTTLVFEIEESED